MSEALESRAYEVRTIDRLMAVLNDGDDCNAASTKLRQLIAELEEYQESHGGKHKGAMTLKFTFTRDAKGMDVQMDFTIRSPPRPVLKDRLFVTERGDLTRKDPGKGTMFEGYDMGRRNKA